MEFLDTNVILRYLTKDDATKAERCYELFQRVKRKEIRLVTSKSVLAEIVYVLSSRALYNQPRENVRALLLPLVSLPALKLPHRRAFLRALDLYATTSFDFEDALSVAHMERQKIKTILSYNEDFDRVEGIERRVP
ncbi:MAG: PIN domain-containing protein [Chloroflexi bacterium]|nr:PIN domain-containing protein [Chloroflexota bacterium]